MKSTSVHVYIYIYIQYTQDICVNNYQLKMKLMYNFLIAVI